MTTYITLNAALDERAIWNPLTAEVDNVQHLLLSLVCKIYGLFSGPLCTYGATWMVNPIDNTIEVEMIHNRRGWIALGFSDDDRMVRILK